jgi:hypothetical protein
MLAARPAVLTPRQGGGDVLSLRRWSCREIERAAELKEAVLGYTWMPRPEGSSAFRNGIARPDFGQYSAIGVCGMRGGIGLRLLGLLPT